MQTVHIPHGLTLTHPNFPEAALSQLDVEAERLSGDLPGVPRQALCLGLQGRAHVRQDVAQAVRMLCMGKRLGL